MKRYDLESNGSEILLFASRHNFFLYENLSALKTSSSIIYRLVNSSGMQLGMISLGKTAETIQHSDSPLSTIFFSLNEPHAHHEQDGM